MRSTPATLGPAWASAFREHDAAVDRFVATLRRVPGEAWHRPTAAGKWSPAGVAVHIARAYEFGHDALVRGTAMQMRTTPLQAWLLRTIVIPVVLATDMFPSGADAPVEVAPDAGESAALSLEQAISRVQHSASAAAAAIAEVAGTQRSFDITHAYFGQLPGFTAFRFVSAHTRHHTRALERLLRR